jgi:hypothetical protein
MAYTAEEQRALNYNLSLQRRVQACRVRNYLLRGSEAAKKGLQDRMGPITEKESNEQREKIQYDKYVEREAFDCDGKTLVNS